MQNRPFVGTTSMPVDEGVHYVYATLTGTGDGQEHSNKDLKTDKNKGHKENDLA